MLPIRNVPPGIRAILIPAIVGGQLADFPKASGQDAECVKQSNIKLQRVNLFIQPSPGI